MSLSEEKKHAYKLDGGQHCPYCGSENIDGGHFECDTNCAWRIVSCKVCGTVWHDEYAFIGMSEIE